MKFTIGQAIRVLKETHVNPYDISSVIELPDEKIEEIGRILRIKKPDKNKVLHILVDSIIGQEQEEVESTPSNKKDEDNKPLTLKAIIRLAGACGLVNFKSMELWELLAFAKGARREAWDMQSCLMSLVHNLHCVKRVQLKSYQDFNPMITHKEKIQSRKSDVSFDTILFGGKNNGKQSR